MAIRTIVGKVYNLLEQPVANAKLTFTLNQSAYTLDRSYETSSTEIKSDALGNWAVALWVNSESLSPTSYTCIDVDGSKFIFTIDPGITPLTYSQIKSLGAPINSPPSSLLGLIGTQVALKADQTALISGLATKVNSVDLTTALSLKADQTALTSGLILKANATESIRLDSAIVLKADQTALISALATKVNSTDLTTALLLKADQTALTNDLALKQNINFPNGRGSISLVQSVGQNMPGGYVYNKYIFGTTIKDTLNEWNSANSFYTATQTGLYLLTIGLDTDNSTSRKFSIMMDYLTSTEIITLFDIQSGGRTIATSMFYWTANTQVYFTNRCPDTFNTIAGNTFLKIERIL